jgi:hypothetical protein
VERRGFEPLISAAQAAAHRRAAPPLVLQDLIAKARRRRRLFLQRYVSHQSGHRTFPGVRVASATVARCFMVRRRSPSRTRANDAGLPIVVRPSTLRPGLLRRPQPLRSHPLPPHSLRNPPPSSERPGGVAIRRSGTCLIFAVEDECSRQKVAVTTPSSGFVGRTAPGDA